VSAEYAALLRTAGLRATAPRVAVLRVLRDSNDHPRVDQVIERVQHAGVQISTQGAYDVCQALYRNGLARRIELPGAPARYEARAGDNHHHLVCCACHAAIDVDCAVGEAPCLQPADPHGFHVHEADVTYWGVCPTCHHSHQEGAPR
jgi:Fe2+ or Zn2+ uptake regulation protein